jgi:hypothetical protein
MSMKTALAFISLSLVTSTLMCGVSLSQSTSTPKLSPEAVKVLQESEKSFERMIEQPNKKPLPTFSIQQCRSDAQAWTEGTQVVTVGHVILVNGQSRMMPIVTSHTPIPKLLDRIYEMTVCERADADFQSQFRTYATMRELYENEHHVRYVKFIVEHNLFERFLQEDAAANK